MRNKQGFGDKWFHRTIDEFNKLKTGMSGMGTNVTAN